VSGFLGQQVSPLHPLPLRTSLQSSENDEAARSASSVFLDYNEDAAEFGGRIATAPHLALGSPVLLNPSKGLYGRDNELFWIRGQALLLTARSSKPARSSHDHFRLKRLNSAFL
jgi:hypothetical protein